MRPAAFLALLLAAPAFAQSTLTTQHVDINLGYPGAWNVTINNENTVPSTVYQTSGAPGAATWAALQVNLQAYVTRPSGPDYDFLGVPDGGKIWRLPQTQNPQLLYLGVSGYRTSSSSQPLTNGADVYANLDSRIDQSANEAPWLRLALTSVQGPGAFSLWQPGDTGPTVWMASANGLTAADSLYVVDGSHNHYNWAFTQAGTYRITFQPSAYFGGVLQTGAPQTVQFNVLAPVPEPASVVGIALAAGGVVTAARRFRRR